MNELLFAMLMLMIILTPIAAGFFKSQYYRGKVGEGLIKMVNSIKLDKSIYTILSNITMKLKDGTTVQIDHIIISKFGIFVIDTKNIKGSIHGSKEQEKWTQNIYDKSYTFQNPLNQNHRHVRAVEETLGLKENVHSVVTFAGECNFKEDMPDNVFMGRAYIGYIKSFNIPIFTAEQVETMISSLQNKSSKSSDKIKKTNTEYILSLNNYR